MQMKVQCNAFLFLLPWPEWQFSLKSFLIHFYLLTFARWISVYSICTYWNLRIHLFILKLQKTFGLAVCWRLRQYHATAKEWFVANYWQLRFSRQGQWSKWILMFLSIILKNMCSQLVHSSCSPAITITRNVINLTSVSCNSMEFWFDCCRGIAVFEQLCRNIEMA